MTEPLRPWWREAQDAAQLLASTVNAAVSKASRDGVYTAPPGAPAPRRRRQPGSLRHLAEVIRTDRLAPGMSVDKDMVAGVLAGDLRYVTEPILVVAVVRAAHRIAGAPFDDADAKRLAVACAHVAALVDTGHEADERAPRTLPVSRPGREVRHTALPTGTGSAAETLDEPTVIDAYFTTRRPRRRRALLASAALVLGATGVVAARFDMPTKKPVGIATASPEAHCRHGANAADIVGNTPALFDDDQATRLTPTLDFDEMNGSARYASHQQRMFYWGRAGSDDATPRSGGARVRWKTPGGPWRSCPVPLAVTERGYVHTPAVATTIGGQPVTVQICLWRDAPRRENCTAEISTGR